MSVRSGIQWVIFIAALVYAWILRGENLELKNQIAGLETTIDSVEEQPPMVPEPVEDLTQIPGAEVAFEEDSIFFTWDQVEEATHYQLIFLTAKMDTLFQRTTVRQSEMRVPFDRIEGFELDASYLFRVDALKSGKPVATTGLVSYPPI